MAGHALLSPSGFKALMLCPAKPAMERGRPDDSSEYADEGTAAHFLGAWCLTMVSDTASCVDSRVMVHPDGSTDWEHESAPAGTRTFNVTPEFAEHVQAYVDTVHERMGAYRKAGAQVELFVEQSVPIGHITGEEGAEGTADTIIVADFGARVTVEVIDLKFGRGVEVSAEDNPQLKLYALGAIEKLGMVYDFTDAVMAICQPRAGGTSEATCAVAELQAWAAGEAADASARAMQVYRWAKEGNNVDALCKPHEDACRWCKAKPDCPALAAKVQTAMGLEFTDLTTASEPEREAIVETAVTTTDAAGKLGAAMDAVPLVEMWCKAIRGKVEKHLLAGDRVEGYKLVAGRKGARGWRDAAEAETLLRKTFRLKVEQAYDLKLISPTSAEKLLKDKPKRWKKAEALVTQSDGSPSVAPIADKRPALEIQPVAAEFTPITDPTPATADDLV